MAKRRSSKKKGKARWKRTTKPRGQCPENWKAVFRGLGRTKRQTPQNKPANRLAATPPAERRTIAIAVIRLVSCCQTDARRDDHQTDSTACNSIDPSDLPTTT